ncbi:hypothetical protein [Streptomyces sp. CAU 1734]|uniref:hypothetical protein n=1 Tax=Streptomyces sp. CAU 1734 TaxID=3140360 RepID=UPI0032607CEF
MGIESDQLVYDYLSRVGDLAQQRQLPSGARMRLVSSLRSEIDRERAGAAADNPASVRRILGRLGTPDEVVAAAGDDPPAPPPPSAPPAAPAPPPPAAAPGARPPGGRGGGFRVPGLGGLPGQRGRRRVPRPRRDSPAVPQPPAGAMPPHLAPMDELGSSEADVDWWSVTPRPFGAGERVAGFTGGVEIPEILKPPPPADDDDADSDSNSDPGAEPAAPAGAEKADGPASGGTRRAALRLLRGRLRRTPEAAPAPVAEPAAEAPPGRLARLGNPFLLLAAALLIAGAAFDSLIALGLGWLFAYGSRRLSVTERKFAVLGLPGAALAAGLVWLWGRTDGRWGDPVPDGGMGDAMTATWPWVLRGAALASALYLIWRARRR